MTGRRRGPGKSSERTRCPNLPIPSCRAPAPGPAGERGQHGTHEPQASPGPRPPDSPSPTRTRRGVRTEQHRLVTLRQAGPRPGTPTARPQQAQDASPLGAHKAFRLWLSRSGGGPPASAGAFAAPSRAVPPAPPAPSGPAPREPHPRRRRWPRGGRRAGSEAARTPWAPPQSARTARARSLPACARTRPGTRWSRAAAAWGRGLERRRAHAPSSRPAPRPALRRPGSFPGAASTATPEAPRGAPSLAAAPGGSPGGRTPARPCFSRCPRAFPGNGRCPPARGWAELPGRGSLPVDRAWDSRSLRGVQPWVRGSVRAGWRERRRGPSEEARLEAPGRGVPNREGVQVGPGGGFSPTRMVGETEHPLSGSAKPLEGGVSLPGMGVPS